MKTVVILNQERMGHGDADLGVRILKTFLQKARALPGLDAFLLYNGGVKLVAEGSPVRAELTLLAEGGVDVVPCGTCLERFGIEPAVGAVGSMDAIVAALSRAEKVITL